MTVFVGNGVAVSKTVGVAGIGVIVGVAVDAGSHCRVAVREKNCERLDLSDWFEFDDDGFLAEPIKRA